MKKSFLLFVATGLISICIALLFASCTEEGKANQPASNAPPKEFPVKKLTLESVVTHKIYPATVEGIQTVELRPRVAGYLEEIYIDEGARVKKGQNLFRINADEFNQQVNSAKANIAVAQAQVNTAKMEVEKQRPLVEKEIVSEYTLTAAQYAQESAEATLKQAEAALQNALTNLSYTVVKSPTDGLIGTIPYRIGSLVSSTIAQPLAMISDISKVRVYFAVNEKDFLMLSRNFAEDNKKGTKMPDKKVNLILVDGTAYDQVGVIDAVSGLISPTTGSATMRATFDNPDGLLRSGSSASVKIPAQIDSALLVPQAATYELQDKRFIYVVNEDNTVKSQGIEVIPDDSGQYFIVQKGLNANDRIVTDGINSLKSDMAITPIVKD